MSCCAGSAALRAGVAGVGLVRRGVARGGTAAPLCAAVAVGEAGGGSAVERDGADAAAAEVAAVAGVAEGGQAVMRCEASEAAAGIRRAATSTYRRRGQGHERGPRQSPR